MSDKQANSPSYLARDLAWSEISPIAWDQAVESAGGSYFLAYSRLRLWRQVQHARRVRVRILQLLLGDTLAGLCVVRSQAGRHIFHERLLLMPGHTAQWRLAFTAVLNHLGSGWYRYGPSNSIAPGRCAELQQIAGVHAVGPRAYAVQAVNFGAYPRWDDYLRDLKPGTRNECRRAENRHQLTLSVNRGRSIWRGAAHLALEMHRQPHRRGQRLDQFGQTLGLALSTATLGTSAAVFAAKSAGNPIALQYHVDFGGNRYYVAGAGPHMQPSPAWWLTLQVLKDAWETNPNGKVILGSFYPDLYDGTGKGLLDFRRRCRAVSFESEILEFRYQGLGTGPGRTVP